MTSESDIRTDALAFLLRSLTTRTFLSLKKANGQFALIRVRELPGKGVEVISRHWLLLDTVARLWSTEALGRAGGVWGPDGIACAFERPAALQELTSRLPGPCDVTIEDAAPHRAHYSETITDRLLRLLNDTEDLSLVDLRAPIGRHQDFLVSLIGSNRNEPRESVLREGYSLLVREDGRGCYSEGSER